MKAFTYSRGLTGLSDLLHTELDPNYTSGNRVLLAGSGGNPRTIPAHSLLGAVYSAGPTVTASTPMGTGNGVASAITGDVGAQPGIYTATIIEPAANGGTFEVTRPDGTVDGAGSIGVAYNGSINFTLSDGTTDFAAGDRVNFTADYGTTAFKLVRWDPAATNGAQQVHSIAAHAAEAESGVDGQVTTLERGPMIIRQEAIAWHDGVTDAQKRSAIAQLEAKGIQCRKSG